MQALNIINAIAKLMDVKSLVTIALTIGFIVMATRGDLTSEYQSVYLVVISFYFGTQYQKRVNEEGSEDIEPYRNPAVASETGELQRDEKIP